MPASDKPRCGRWDGGPTSKPIRFMGPFSWPGERTMASDMLPTLAFLWNPAGLVERTGVGK